MYRRLTRIDDDSLLESDTSMILKNIRSNLNQYRNGVVYGSLLEAISNDVVDIMMAKEANADDDPECLPDLVHKMNCKMALVKDYVENDKNMTKDEMKQWNHLYREMQINRNQISHAMFYKKRQMLYNRWNTQEEV